MRRNKPTLITLIFLLCLTVMAVVGSDVAADDGPKATPTAIAPSTPAPEPSTDPTEQPVVLDPGSDNAGDLENPQIAQTYCQMDISDLGDNNPFTYQFSASVAHNIETFAWNLGDTTTSSQQTVTHTYTATGTFSIALTCTPFSGFGSPMTLNGSITISSVVAASFTLTPATAIIGLPPFTISTVNSSTGGSLSYSWKISDSANPLDPGFYTATTQNISYVFNPPVASMPVTYWFHLTVTDGAGISAGASQSVVFSPPAPEASFTLTPGDGIAPLTVTVEGVDLGAGPITTWSWDFDGDSLEDASGQGPHNFVYNAQGVYTITLTYSGPGGNGTFSRQVGVYPGGDPVQAIFSYQLTGNGVGGIEVCYTNQSTGPVTTSIWDFGDGSPLLASNDAVVCHLYASENVYTVTLSVANNDNSSTSTASNAVSVIGAPVAAFTVSPGNNIVWGTNINLDSSGSTGAITSYAWDFPGGSAVDSIVPNPTNVALPTLGANLIRLTVTGPGGSSSAEAIVYVARLEITCDFTGTLNVLPTAGPQTYTSVIGNQGGRPITYNWTVTGNGVGLPLSFNTPNITVDWAAIGTGAFQVTLSASATDGSDCTASKTVNRTWPALNCLISGSVPNPLYADGATYNFTANVQNLAGRTVLSYDWLVNGVSQGVTTSSFNWVNTTSTAGLPATFVIRFNVVVDNADSTTSDCYEELLITVQPWPTLTCNSINGQANPLPATPDNPTRNYTYTANVSGLAGRPASYLWAVSDGIINSANPNTVNNQANVTWNATAGSLPPAPTDDNINVVVTVTNPDGTTVSCSMNRNVTVTIPRLTCATPVGDIDPVVGENSSYNTAISNTLGRPAAAVNPLVWELEEWNGSAYVLLTTGTTNPFSYTFLTPGSQYRIRYSYAVDAAGNLPADNCTSPYLNLTVNAIGVNFQCDSAALTGNLTPNDPFAVYSYTIDMDNGNGINLQYYWVLVDSANVDHDLGTTTSPLDGIITSPGFTLAQLAPLGIDINTLRVDVSAVNPADSTYTCSRQATLSVGTLNVNYTYTGNNNAIAVGQDICLTNTSSATPGDINSLTYTWAVSGNPANNSWGSGSSTAQQPGCIYLTQPGSYTITLTGVNASGLRSGTRTVTFTVFGLQNIVITRSNQVFAPANVSFTATGTNVSFPYSWQFRRVSDNSLVSSFNSNTATVTQFFATPDVYRAIVSANGPLGTTTAQLEFELIDTNQLRAAFTPSVYGGIAPLYVCFTDNSVGTNILTWSWDFDGDSTPDLNYDNTSIPGSICYTYTAPGTVYQARLTITNSMFTNTATNTIRTYTLLESNATFTISPQGGGQYCFTAILNGNITVTGWEYGDGNTGPGQNTICHVYAASGTYLVLMHITDGTNTGTVVRPVVVTLTGGQAPALNASGFCAADRTATFTINNTGGAMTIPDQVMVRDNAGNIILIDSLLLSANGSRTFTLTDQSGNITLSLTDNPGVVVSTVCNYPPEISVAAACGPNILPIFTISNARPGDGPMVAPQSYDILDSASNVVTSGTFYLPLGVAALDIAVPNGNNPYDTYAFISTGAVGTFNTPHNCATQPVLNLAGVCAGDVAFTITNTSAFSMVVPQAFTIVDGSNQDVTPAPNSFQLNAGESITITLAGSNPYAGYTLTSTGFAGTLSHMQNCAQPDLNVATACSSPITFTVMNTGGNMLAGQPYTVTDSASTVVASGSLNIANGQSQAITLTGLDPYAAYMFSTTGFAGTLSAANDCANPDLNVVSTCSYPLVFTVQNTGGDMLEAQPYTVQNAAGDIVLTGSFMLASGAVEDIVLAGLDPYAGYTIQGTGFAGSIILTQDCTRPVLQATTTCSEPAAFVITNTGGDMLTLQWFTVTNAAGADVTPSPNTFQLASGSNMTITLIGLNPYAVYTLASSDFAGTLAITQPCARPNLVVSADCVLPASFLLENLGGDMLVDHTYQLIAASGEDVTPAQNTFRLLAGESLRIRVPAGVDITQGVTLVTVDLEIATSGTMKCVLPGMVDDATTARFTGVSSGLNLPDWNNVATCGYSCPPFRLYHTDETGNWEIFRLDGADPINRQTFRVNISQGVGEGVHDMSPSISPNNKWVVFTSNRDGNWELYVAPLTDDPADQALGIQRVTYNKVAIDTDPAWGPNNFVVYETTRHGNWDLYMVDMTTGQEYRVTDSQADDINPFWSPDGSKLAFQSNRDGNGWQIYEFNLLTRTLQRLSDGTAIDVDPQYSFDGTRIAFRRYISVDGNSQIMLMNADGQNVEAITSPDEDATNAAWSPDDRLIAYQSNRDGDLDIYIYEVATRTTRQLTDNTIPDYAPSWWCTPDRVLFTSDIAGNPDIYEADAAPMSNPAIRVEEAADQLTFETTMDIYPQASPNEENASREGQTVLGTFGEQTSFLHPAVNLTPEDLSFDGLQRQDWKQVEVCSRH